MGLYRIFPTKDNWITTKQVNTAANIMTGSNHGKDPALSVFAVKEEFTSDVNQLSRILIQFPIVELSGKIFNEQIIPSSSVSYHLRLFDMKHGKTVPTSYDLFAFPLSRSWDEGNGIDSSNFLDAGWSNWIDATSTTSWVATGSDYVSTGYGSGSQHFDRGTEDFEVDVTSVVNAWLSGNLENNGFLIKLGDTEETNSTDYYLKLFHGFESKFVDKLPYLEARWSSVLKDNRNNFAFNQQNNLYLYNFVRGELTSLQEPISVSVVDTVASGTVRYSSVFSATQVEPGIYTVSTYISNTASFSGTLFDIWFSGSSVYMTGTFVPLVITGSSVDQYSEFVCKVDNLKQIYSVNEEARMKVNVRKRDYKTHVGSFKSGSLVMEKEYIEKMYYSISNNETGEVLIPFGTGSLPYTQLSYDGNGNYFNLFMNSFVPGFVYRIKFLIDINKYDRKIIDDNFVFKVI
jgi:hypothetical protein